MEPSIMFSPFRQRAGSLRRFFRLGAAALVVFGLAACASAPPKVRSDVTAFHNWPAKLPSTSFSFTVPPGMDGASIELQNYQTLIADQLARYGIDKRVESGGGLRVSFSTQVGSREVKVREPVDPFFYGGYYRPWGWGPYWGPWGFPERQYNVEVFVRTLKLNIDDANGKRLFETTVVSQGRIRELSAVMPAMITAAFEGFPGESGKTRVVEIPLEQPLAAAPAQSEPKR
jgi:hypothetical protein